MSEDLLSPELRAALGGGTDLVLPSRKKKKNGKKKVKRKRPVDPALLRVMRKMNKKKRRKFLRSQERKLEKKDRTKIYDKMKKNAISADHLALLGQSGRVGQDLSRKQKLQRDLRLVRAKVEIDQDSELLRRRKSVVEEEEEMEEEMEEEEEEEEVMTVDQNQDDNETKETTVEEENVPKYVGVEIETHRESRCKHYHSKLDVLALESSCCNKFYSCVKCHDEMENHAMIPWDSDTSLNRHALLCGVCEKTFSIRTWDMYNYICLSSQHCTLRCQKCWNKNSLSI